MYGCVYVCKYVRVCVCMNVWMYACMNIRMFVCSHVCMYVCTALTAILWNIAEEYVCVRVRACICGLVKKSVEHSLNSHYNGRAQ